MPTVEMERRQIVVIGAGPSGAIAAALLKRQGHDVLVIERQHFPRFSIGESLLAHCLISSKRRACWTPSMPRDSR